MPTHIKKAVIPVAGLGTRFLPITKAIPKEMLPIVDRPMIQLIVEEALNSGIEQIILINGHHKGNIEDYFDTNYELNDVLKKKRDNKSLHELNQISYGSFICSLRQKQAAGLGHAILCARPLIENEPFAVLLGDDLIFTKGNTAPALKQLIDSYYKSGLAQVALKKVARKEIHKYGVAEGKIDPSNHKIFHIKNLQEKPPLGTEKSDLAIVGRYVLTPEIWELLTKVKAKTDNEIDLTAALIGLAKKKNLMGYLFDGERIDAGDRIGFLRANLVYALNRKDIKNEVAALLKELA